MEAAKEGDAVDVEEKTQEGKGPAGLEVKDVFIDFAKVNFPDLVKELFSFWEMGLGGEKIKRKVLKVKDSGGSKILS